MKAILIERDYKGIYERFALTPDEFIAELPLQSSPLFPGVSSIPVTSIIISSPDISLDNIYLNVNR